MVVRHYKIYYHVRHQMIQFIMNGVQRLVMAQGSIDNRRLAIDVCEMVIKWEQWRLKQIQEAVSVLFYFIQATLFVFNRRRGFLNYRLLVDLINHSCFLMKE